MSIIKGDERREARIRLGFSLQMKHSITPSDIAELLGFTEKTYRNRLRRLKLDASKTQIASTTDDALKRLQDELRKLLEGDELPVKGKAEALMALAKAVKAVGELVSETDSQKQDLNASSVISLNETRQALAHIDRRIEELAQKRAREILGGGIDARTDSGSGAGMADQSS